MPAKFANITEELSGRMAETIAQFLKETIEKNVVLEQQVERLTIQNGELIKELNKRPMPERARDGRFVPKRRT